MARMPNAHAFSWLVPEPGPRRIFALGAFVNATGFGLVFTAMALYFTRVLHLSITEVGIGLTAAGLIGMLAGIPVGHLADLRGPRQVVRATLLIQVLVTLGFLVIPNFWGFVTVATLEVMCFDAYNAASGALLRRVGGEKAAAYRSQVRALGNIAISLGAVGSGVAIAIDTPTAYRTLIVINAVTFVATWVVLGKLPHFPPLPKPKEEGPRWIALRDRPFVVYAALAGALSMQYWVITDPLPLWTVNYTDAPRWGVAAFLVVNTVCVALMQVRVGRNVETLEQGGRALRRSGVIFLFSCSAIGLAAGLPGWIALLWLLGAIALHTYGEVWYSSAQFALDFGLPPAHAQGQYQGLAGIGTTLGSAAAPALMLGIVLSLGTVGWIGLGVLFALLGLAGPAVARWGERTRPEAAELTRPEPAVASS
jgi:MFS family permease